MNSKKCAHKECYTQTKGAYCYEHAGGGTAQDSKLRDEDAKEKTSATNTNR